MITRADAAAFDTADPLASVRDRFRLPPGVVYLDGNSLGALPEAVPQRIQDVVEQQWGSDLIRSWNSHGWVDLPFRVGERIGRLIGAEPGSVVAADSTSINVFKTVAAARRLRPDRPVIITDSSNFPTDVYVMGSVAELTAAEVLIVDSDDVIDAIDDQVAVVALTEVDYRTGRRHNMQAVTAAAHQVGALTVWDLAHSAGAFPVDLAGAEADFAVGCGYKYLNGGPGAPAFIYVAPRHQSEFVNPVTGWFGHAAPFEFSLVFTPADGIGRARIGTPHILSLAALDAALDVFDGLDVEAVRAKSLALTALFMDLVDERLEGFEIVTPRNPDRRGSQVSLRHEHAYPIVQALIDRDIIGDFRMPDIARFGFAALYVRFVDVWDAVDTLAAVMETDAWKHPRYQVRRTVT